MYYYSDFQIVYIGNSVLCLLTKKTQEIFPLHEKTLNHMYAFKGLLLVETNFYDVSKLVIQ
jgi:hypothetical protein